MVPNNVIRAPSRSPVIRNRGHYSGIPAWVTSLLPTHMYNYLKDYQSMKLIVVGNLGERELLKGPLYMKTGNDGKLDLGKDLASREVLVLVLKPVPEDKADYSGNEKQQG